MILSAGHAFATVDCPPAVSEIDASSYWSNYTDYRDRLLTVDETIRNDSPCQTCKLQLEGIDASNGVSLETPMPRYLGNLSQAALEHLSMKFRVPHGVGSFHSRVRFVCLPDAANPPGPTAPIAQNLMNIDPDFALANEGCPADPMPETGIHPFVMDTTYGPRRFVVTMKDADGNPLAGKTIKWSLSDNYDFSFLDSSTVTDEAGQAYAVVTPPRYFICIVPYFSKGLTVVGATSEDGQTSDSQFAYTRCAPPGSAPPSLNLSATS